MRILIPTDFSEFSKVAINYAAALGSVLDLELILLNVIDIKANAQARVRSKKLEEIIKADANAEMKQLLASLKDSLPNNVSVRSHVIVSDYIEEEVEGFAKQNDVDLICIGTKGATGLKKVFMGSNAARIIEKSSVAVLTIPEEANFSGFNKMVYSSDFCDLDNELGQIMPFVKMFNAQLHILHVAKDKKAFTGQMEPLEAKIRADFNYQKVKLARIKSDSVEEGIANYLNQIGGDIIIMFTHHTSFLEQMFKKSVSQKTAFQTRIPLLTLQKEQEDNN